MIIKCRNCSGALTYDAATGKMLCKYCSSTYAVDEVGSDDRLNSTIECDVMLCTTCGAELCVNGVETSTFCAYCGQPTVIFDRVDVVEKPMKIVPFSVTKEQAVNNIRHHFSKGFFVPDGIKNFEVERVTGIYVPYWLYNVYYYDKQTITCRSGKHTYTHYREAESEFKNLTVDASSNFCNESSEMLEPFYVNDAKEFNEAYLSGFYADRYDQSSRELESLAVFRCKELFDQQMKDSVGGTSKVIKESNPKSNINGQEYAMLPAWFMTMRYEDKPYTMLVNGQTGKTVGAVPIEKKKVIAAFAVIFAILAAIIVPICMLMIDAAFLGGDIDDEFVEFIMYLIIGGGALIAYGFRNYNKLKWHIGNTSAKEMNVYANNRQEGDR